MLQGAAKLLAKYPPKAILTEYTPGVQERGRSWSQLADYPASLRKFEKAGYQIWHLVGTSKGRAEVGDLGDLGDWSKAEQPCMQVLTTAPQSPQVGDWSKAVLPALAEVTPDTLRAEELNARNMIADNGKGGSAFMVPWDLHPLSLHAEFAHNTDLLLTLTPGIVHRSRVVELTPS